MQRKNAIRETCSGGHKVPWMKKKSILVVEDDLVFGKVLCMQLQQEGYNCTLLDNIDLVMAILDEGPFPDLFILDYELGTLINGLDICRSVKTRMQLPILMLTGNDAETTVVNCLDAGADQYLVKPYNKLELLARIRTALRKYPKDESSQPDSGSAKTLKLDVNHRMASLGNRSIAITEKESMLLNYLLGNLGIELSRENMHFMIHGTKPDIYSRSMDVLVGRTRKKLKQLNAPYTINHIRSYGYVMHRLPDFEWEKTHAN